ncbi:hypothetical protein [Sunxiuqinia elliptica]|uniref:Uncharacterized protein n=1 Tax=Sunxiuqinia elliptica TaxID=655355 RepID=A0A1I2HQ32_9BACT|nr:hypothetical protein [Sunxiuqinia elliptica]SFF30481.1 hypothetical protein SAMN05216283_104142 [Sunxiuqinia elliptica]
MNRINLEIAKQYANENELTKIMGFILFTDNNPYVKKVLRDDDFWQALDEISGNEWAIFSIKPKQGKIEIPTSKGNFLQMMVPVWKEPKENLKLMQEFDLKDTSKLPMLLIVSQNEEGEILKCEFPIENSNLDSVYNSLKEGIEIVKSTIDEILPQFKKNDEVFINVQRSIEYKLIWKKIHKGLKFYSWINGLIP